MLKNILLMISNSILNYIIFIQYLKTKNYSGGEVGMVPLVILLNFFLSYLFSITTIFISRSFYNWTFLKTLLLYNIFYFIIFLFWGLHPLEGQGFLENVDLFVIISAVVSMFLTFVVAHLYENFFTKKNSNFTRIHKKIATLTFFFKPKLKNGEKIKYLKF